MIFQKKNCKREVVSTWNRLRNDNPLRKQLCCDLSGNTALESCTKETEMNAFFDGNRCMICLQIWSNATLWMMVISRNDGLQL